MHRNILSLLAIPLLLCGCTAKAKLERHVKRADSHYEKGDYEKARIEYLNAFQLDKNNAHVAARLAESFLKDGDIQRGFQLYAHALALQPTNTDVRVKMASVLLIGGEPAKAREQAIEILKQAPTHPDALLLLGNASSSTNEIADARRRIEPLATPEQTNSAVFLALGSLAQRSGAPAAAETALKKAVAMDPKSARNNLVLGSFYFLRGATNNAETFLKAAMDLSAPKSVERLGFAEFLFKTGRSKEAEAILAEATAKHPDFHAAWNVLTQIALSQNDTNKAAGYIASALATDPQNRDALLNQARLKMAARDFKSALPQLESLAAAHPRDGQIHYQLALAEISVNEPLKALASLDKAISSNTNHVDALLLRARVHLSRNDWGPAMSELHQFIRRFPGIVQAQYLLASAHQARGNMDDALAAYTAITKAFPKEAAAYQMMGGIYRQQNKIPQARQAFEQALAVQPDLLGAIDGIIELDIAAQQFEPALSRARSYIAKFPKSPLPHLLEGKIFFQQQKNAEAEAAVQRAIELDPEFMPAHRALTEFYIRSGQTDKAVAKLQSLVQANSKDVGSLIQLGILYESKADYTRARETYEALLKVNPNSVAALNNLAYILSERMGNVEQAWQHARKAREVAPQDPFAADTFGWILWRRGEYNESLAAIQQAAERLAEQPEVQYHLGMAHYMVGSIEPARAALTRAVQSTNDFLGKEAARGALAILQTDAHKATPETVALLQRQATQNPKDTFAHSQLARVYEAASDWKNARQTYEKGLAANPRSALLLSGLAALFAGPLQEPERALELSKRAWTISPIPSTAAVLGPVAYQAGDYKWASGRLLEAAASGGNAEILYYRGLTAYALGNIPQARQDLARASEAGGLSQENAALATAALDLIKFHLGESAVDAAAPAVETARRLNPQFPPALVGAGLIAEQRKDFEGARRAYEAALKARPGLLVAQRQLAILLGEKLADDARAHQLATSLQRDFPNDPALSRVLGKIAYRRADYREAARLLGRSGSNQQDGELLYYLGMAQYHLQESGAKANLTRAIALEPNGTLAPDARKALAALK